MGRPGGSFDGRRKGDLGNCHAQWTLALGGLVEAAGVKLSTRVENRPVPDAEFGQNGSRGHYAELIVQTLYETEWGSHLV